MTQKTTTLAEKLESIKAALESIRGIPACALNVPEYTTARAKEALATLQELETEMASEEMVKKIEDGISKQPLYDDGEWDTLDFFLTGDQIKAAAKAARKTILGK